MPLLLQRLSEQASHLQTAGIRDRSISPEYEAEGAAAGGVAHRNAWAAVDESDTAGGVAGEGEKEKDRRGGKGGPKGRPKRIDAFNWTLGYGRRSQRKI